MVNFFEDIKSRIVNKPTFSVLLWYCQNGLSKLELQLCLADGKISYSKIGKVKDPNIPQNQRRWEREEVVLLVTEYFRTKELTATYRKESVELVSRILRNRAIAKGENISDTLRNTNGINMQFACIKGLDPDEVASGHTGLSGSSKLQKQVVEEYFENPEKIKAEAALVFVRYEVDNK